MSHTHDLSKKAASFQRQHNVPKRPVKKKLMNHSHADGMTVYGLGRTWLEMGQMCRVSEVSWKTNLHVHTQEASNNDNSIVNNALNKIQPMHGTNESQHPSCTEDKRKTCQRTKTGCAVKHVDAKFKTESARHKFPHERRTRLNKKRPVLWLTSIGLPSGHV